MLAKFADHHGLEDRQDLFGRPAAVVVLTFVLIAFGGAALLTATVTIFTVAAVTTGARAIAAQLERAANDAEALATLPDRDAA